MIPFLTYAGIKKEKDIAYADKGERNLLDVYFPNDTQMPKDVIVFIHGGSWRSGSKNTYWFLGNNFARKNKVVVIINYPLAPNAQYQEMAFDCARAIKWVGENIKKYGGNPDRIFVMGHSAGAHLGSLINQDEQYFKKMGIKNPIKGLILNDAFGLNINEYMKAQINTDDEYMAGFLQVFGTDEQNWFKASPINYVEGVNNPYLMFMGGKTYPSIKKESPEFYQKLNLNNKKVFLTEVKGKRHIGMLTQMLFGWNKLYDDILDFMSKN